MLWSCLQICDQHCSQELLHNFWIYTALRYKLHLHITSFFNNWCKKMTRYLHWIKNIWTLIIKDEKTDQLQLNVNVIAILQSCCFLQSLKDRAHIQIRMLADNVFLTITADDQRSWIFDHAYSIEHVILLIHIFFKDIKYFESLARILKKLLLSKCKNFMSQHFNALHSEQMKMKMQMSEYIFKNWTLSFNHSSWLLYCQLWLFALHHFLVMNDQSSWRNKMKQSALHEEWQLQWWYELWSLMSKNNYRRIHCLYRDHKVMNIKTIKNCMQNILSFKYYVINLNWMRQIMLLNCQLFSDVLYVKKELITSTLISNYESCESNIFDQCNRSWKHSFQANEKSLFLEHIYSTFCNIILKHYLTFFVIKWDFFRAFFNLKEDDLNQQSSFKTF